MLLGWNRDGLRWLRRSGAALVLALGVVGTASVQAADELPLPSGAQADAIKTSVEAWLKGKYKVSGLSGTAMPGVVEVRIGQQLIYSDLTGRYVLVEGQMVDTKTGDNLTEARIEEIQMIKWSDLPLNLALKTVKGNGKRQIAVFEDPNCGYCRQFRKQVLGMTDITIYTFIYPILAADSDSKSKTLWCQKDRLKAWDEWMLEGKMPAAANCDNPIPKVVELGKKLGVSGTPTVFYQNGKRSTGAIPPARFEKLLSDAQPKA